MTIALIRVSLYLSLIYNIGLMFGVLSIIFLTNWPLGEGLTSHVFVKGTDYTLFGGRTNWPCICGEDSLSCIKGKD